MLCRERISRMSGKRIMVFGQVLLLIGLGCLIIGQIMWHALPMTPGFSWVDFGKGFFHGVGGTLMGVSVVLNVTGLRRFNSEKRREG